MGTLLGSDVRPRDGAHAAIGMMIGLGLLVAGAGGQILVIAFWNWTVVGESPAIGSPTSELVLLALPSAPACLLLFSVWWRQRVLATCLIWIVLNASFAAIIYLIVFGTNC